MAAPTNPLVLRLRAQIASDATLRPSVTIVRIAARIVVRRVFIRGSVSRD